MNPFVESFRLDHLGIPAQLAQDIGFCDAIDEMAGVDQREILSTGQAVLAMTLNCLGFTSRPLYIAPQFFETRNVKFLLGESKSQPETILHPDHLNQHKLGRTLDRIAELGPDRVFLEVALRAFRAEKVKVPMIHEDTTTHSLYGVYSNEDGSQIVSILGEETDEPVPISVTYGYSKDNRANCKQVVQELLVSSDGDVPLMFKAWSGNASDVIVMKERIKNLKTCLKNAGAEDLFPEYFVADSKLYCQESIEAANKDDSFWITRVPDTVKDVDECITLALRSKKFWNKADHLTKGLSWQEFVVTKYDIKQRFIVVRTEASKNRTQAAIMRKVEIERKTIESNIKKMTKKSFACVPDLEKAWLELFAKSMFHDPGELVIEKEERHRQVGRPKKGEEGGFLYSLKSGTIKQNTDPIRREKLEGACFVIATNDLRNETKPEDILRYYMKDQQGVERSFRFLKDPQYFADAFFLKSPGRIAALLCVMTLALLLFSLAQRKLRLELDKKKMTVKNQVKKPTNRPTMRWVHQHFEGVDVTRVTIGKTVTYHFHRLVEFEEQVLLALGANYRERYSEKFVG